MFVVVPASMALPLRPGSRATPQPSWTLNKSFFYRKKMSKDEQPVKREKKITYIRQTLFFTSTFFSSGADMAAEIKARGLAEKIRARTAYSLTLSASRCLRIPADVIMWFGVFLTDRHKPDNGDFYIQLQSQATLESRIPMTPDMETSTTWNSETTERKKKPRSSRQNSLITREKRTSSG